MNRNVDLKQISDGKLYDAGDMVKAGTGDCIGCHACCTGMGDTITLDPYDAYRLEKGLGMSFEELLSTSLELRVADGIILPCLKMGDGDACTFLNDEGRCSIHPHRPGICRLFPLGRIYEDGTHRYFLQVNECHKNLQTKVKIKKWIDTPDFSRYESYIDRWHFFIKGIAEKAPEMPAEQLKAINMGLLRKFFLSEYNTEEDFYTQFDERMSSLS